MPGLPSPPCMRRIILNDRPITIVEKVDARDLEILLAVAETCSFRKAATKLHIGQSAVSRRVQKLEDLLGVSLFERRTTGARLTNAGSEFVACSSAIFENLKAAVARAQTAGIATGGKLKIGSMASFSNGPQRALIKTFVDRHPRVDLCFVECERQHMMTMLGHRTLDLVLSVGDPSPENGDGFVLVRAPVYLAVASSEPWAEAKQLEWSDVTDAPFLVSARESGPDIHDYIVRRSTALGRTVSIARHQVSRDGIMNLVGLGLGVTVVGDHAAGARYPDVRLVPIGDNENIPFSICWRPENDNPALRRFISLARIEAKKNGLRA